MMQLSRLFGQTLREAPGDAETISHQLLLRAGFIRPLASGIFTSLPLARRSLSRIEAILREEINAIGGQEITMPVVHPAEIWQVTGRWYQIGSEMGRFKDKNNHDMVLAMTHEEVVADLVRREIRSYRQLPALVYQIQTKWRDDPRPRAGLIRVREFSMLDSYSLDATWEGLDAQYQAHYQAYFKIFERCGLPVHAVKSDTGMMGGEMAHEYMYLTPVGEDTLLFCSKCSYSANRQVARFARQPSVEAAQLPRALQKVATPHASSIAELSRFLQILPEQTAKAVFLMAELGQGDERRMQFIFAAVRGDLEVNESKLTNVLGAEIGWSVLNMRPALEEEIRAVGAEPGYASPVGLKPGAAWVVVDESIPTSPNLVAGANEEGYHLLNVNYGRDFSADCIADLAAAPDGAACPECGAPMAAHRGVEVGNIFKLGTRYSEAAGCNYRDEEGKNCPVIMGSYGIGVGRLLACIAEEHHDENGLCWPVSVAPYPVHLVQLPGRSSNAPQVAAAELAARLEAAGLEPLVDDREESAGVKFMDADLIGLPVRLTVSERALQQGGVEFKLRTATEKQIIPMEEIPERLKNILNNIGSG